VDYPNNPAPILRKVPLTLRRSARIVVDRIG